MPYANPFSEYDYLGRSLLEVNPESAYDVWLRALMGQPGGNKGYTFGQTQYDPIRQGYYSEAAKPGRWGLSWTDYLNELALGGNSPKDIWGGLSPTQRGERPGMFGPRSQWQPQGI